ncbi:MAG: ethanolamine utilization protein EutH [Mediterraneibacter faecis]
MGNRWGYGQQFEEGFHAIGPMMLAMAGVIAWQHQS